MANKGSQKPKPTLLKKILKITAWTLGGLLVIVLIGLLIFIRVKSHAGLPDYGADISIKNLSSNVEVYRDEYGTPHIYAENQADLYRAVGYVMAQDRLWQMDLLRRVTLGRLSEIFGDDFVETDILLRSLRYSAKSEELLKTSPPEVIEALEAFSDGVNQYIEQSGKDLSVEFFLLKSKPENWEPVHSLNLIGYMAWDLKAGWGELVLDNLKTVLDSAHYAAIVPDISKYSTYVFPEGTGELMAENKLTELSKLEPLGVDILCGSNNWAVAGKKSTTGKPIVANDMHLGFSIPGIWMQMHQVVRGQLNVTGLALPGQPLIIVGHNDSIAWGMTNTYVDNLDFYEERINPADSNQYELDGEWKNFSVVNEEIRSSSGAVFSRSYKYNHRGPVVSENKKVKDKVLTIHWAGDEQSNEMLAIYRVNRANNWTEFKESFKTFESISQNVVYADIEGNIGMYSCAGVPIRKRNHTPFEVLPGWTSEYDWQGMVPFEELPHEYNPERGWVSSANNRTIDDSYPYHIGVWYSMPYRIERINEMLQAKEKLSMYDFRLMQNDYQSTLGRRLVSRLFVLLDESTMNPEERKMALLLKNWDGSMDKELIEPTIAEAFTAQFIKAVFADEMGEKWFSLFESNDKLSRTALFNLLESNSGLWVDNINTPGTETLADMVDAAYKNTMAYLNATYSTKTHKWKWGNIHTITLQHPLAKVRILDRVFNLNRGPFAVSGSHHTVAPYGYPGFSPDKVEHGASHRHIYSLSNWDSTISVIPTGNSGIIKSEFYCNQTSLYISGGYHADYFSKELIKEKSKYSVVIKPAQE